ncbi:unnamed protein product [Clonostachys solani]|uniref:non-specific serine/threonine protein kinase n=1 Tax=Clonostachys solani TaxID=160281 RepID=A0A9N9ZF68_9HYPO|nr:unnamed protein product [Clonostachys solani]
MAALANIADLKELVRDSQLHATFRSKGGHHYIVHTRDGHRAKQTQEVWAHVKNLGQGGQGSVDLQVKQSHAQRKPQYRAVKCIRIPEAELGSNQDFYVRELEAIIKFSQIRYGELFVKTFGWFAQGNKLFIAMEYCPLGDLEKYLANECPNSRLPEDQVHEIASQVLDAVSRMHEENFAHRDLKPANILVQSHPPDAWVVKLGDFGISRRDQGVPETTTVRGTPRFMSPELLGFTDGNSRCSNLYAVDMWCLGETIFRILSGRPTFLNHADLCRFCLGQLEFPADILRDLHASEDAIDFLKSLIVNDPDNRLTAEGASAHAWIMTESNVSDLESTGNPRPWSIINHSFPGLALPSLPDMSTEASASWPAEGLTASKTMTESQNPMIRNPSRQSGSSEASASWTAAGLTSGKTAPENQTLTIRNAPSQYMTTTASASSTADFTPKFAQTIMDEQPKPSNNAQMPALWTWTDSSVPNPQATISSSSTLTPSRTRKGGGLTAKIKQSIPVATIDRMSSTEPSNKPGWKEYHELERAANSDFIDRKFDSAERKYAELARINKNFQPTFKTAPKLYLELKQAANEKVEKGLVEEAKQQYAELERFKHNHQSLPEDFTDDEILELIRLEAGVLFDKGSIHEACEAYNNLLRLSNHWLGIRDPVYFRDQHNYATILFELGRFSDAETVYSQALAGRRKALGPEHSDTLNTMHDTADTLRQTGQTGRAEELYREVIEIRSRLDDPKMLQSMEALVDMLLDGNNYARAQPVLMKIVEVKQKQKAEPEDIIKTLYQVAQGEERSPGGGQAKLVYENILSAREKALGAAHPLTVESRNHLSTFVKRQDENLRKSTAEYQTELQKSKQPAARDVETIISKPAAETSAGAKRPVRTARPATHTTRTPPVGTRPPRRVREVGGPARPEDGIDWVKYIEREEKKRSGLMAKLFKRY